MNAKVNHPVDIPAWYDDAKRAVDIGFALIAGATLSAPMLLISAAVKYSSPGPVLFKQQRVGLNGKIFTMLKFRSMQVNSARDPSKIVQTNDPEITPIGRLLRRSRLDELPQLWNVLKGEMTIVGPRPHPVEHAAEVAEIEPRYQERLTVRPGLVSLAHLWLVEGYHVRTPEDVAKKILPYDFQYVQRRTPEADLFILLCLPLLLAGGYGV